MNSDAPEVDSFYRRCYQALSSPCFLRRKPGNGATLPAPILVYVCTVRTTGHREKFSLQSLSTCMLEWTHFLYGQLYELYRHRQGLEWTLFLYGQLYELYRSLSIMSAQFIELAIAKKGSKHHSFHWNAGGQLALDTNPSSKWLPSRYRQLQLGSQHTLKPPLVFPKRKGVRYELNFPTQ